MFLNLHPMVFIVISLLFVLEWPVVLMTLIFEIKFRLQNLSKKVIDIINFVKRFQNIIDDILTKCLNIMSD